MNKLKLYFFQFTLSLFLIMGLSACSISDDDDDGDSSNTQQVTIKGTAVKGTLADAMVEAFLAANMNSPIATASTDENGNFVLTFETDTSQSSGAITIKVSADDNTTMVCDADKCGSVNFGDTIAASDLTGLELLSQFALEAGVTAIDDIPVNSLTTAATEVIMQQAEDLSMLDTSSLSELQTMATQVIMSALGVNASTDANLFDYNVPDASMLSEALANASSAEKNMLSQLAMLNASFAANTDIQSALNMFSTELSTSIDNSAYSANLTSYLADMKTAYADLFAMLNSLDGGLPSGVSIPDLNQISWPDNIDFTDDGIVIDPGEGMDGDWTLVVTGTATVTTPVTITVDIPSVTIENTMPPSSDDTQAIEEAFTSQAQVEGVTISDYSFEITENTSTKVVVEYSATITVTAQGVTSSQTQNLVYTWTKN